MGFCDGAEYAIAQVGVKRRSHVRPGVPPDPPAAGARAMALVILLIACSAFAAADAIPAPGFARGDLVVFNADAETSQAE